MHLQGLSHLQVYDSTLEALTKSGLILVLGVAIVASNILIIATFLNFRGQFQKKWRLFWCILTSKYPIIFLFAKSFLRSIRSNKLLLVVTGGRRFTMRTTYCTSVGVSSTHRRVDIRRHTLSLHWIPRGYPVVSHSVHIHVDFSRQIFGCT